MQAGQDLRLVVKDVNAERVLLAITDPHEEQSAQAQQTQQAQPEHSRSRCRRSCRIRSLAAQRGCGPIPLPGGGNVQVTERDAGGRRRTRRRERQNVLAALRRPGAGRGRPALSDGRGGAEPRGERWPPGQPLELAQAGAESLRQALHRVDRPAAPCR